MNNQIDNLIRKRKGGIRLETDENDVLEGNEGKLAADDKPHQNDEVPDFQAEIRLVSSS